MKKTAGSGVGATATTVIFSSWWVTTILTILPGRNKDSTVCSLTIPQLLISFHH